MWLLKGVLYCKGFCLGIECFDRVFPTSSVLQWVEGMTLLTLYVDRFGGFELWIAHFN